MVERPPTDWEPPALAVFVSGCARSGSTLLCGGIRETKVLGVPHEYFNLDSVSVRKLAANYAESCMAMGKLGSTSNGIATSKIFARHCEKAQATISLDDWFPRQSWIYLRRRDAVGQAISWAIAEQIGKWTFNQKQKVETPPSYSRALVEKKLAMIERAHAFWQQYFSARKIVPLPLWYEDVEASLHQAVELIATHVGGEAMREAVRRSEPFVNGTFESLHTKQRNEVNADWRMRFLGFRSET